MASLYADEDFHYQAVTELRRLGHDGLTVQEAGQGGQGVTDPQGPPFPGAPGSDARPAWAGAGPGAGPLAGFDGVLVRTMPPGSLEQVVFRMDLLPRLAARGVRVVNPPRAVEVCVDKYLAAAKLAAAGLP